MWMILRLVDGNHVRIMWHTYIVIYECENWLLNSKFIDWIKLSHLHIAYSINAQCLHYDSKNRATRYHPQSSFAIGAPNETEKAGYLTAAHRAPSQSTRKYMMILFKAMQHRSKLCPFALGQYARLALTDTYAVWRSAVCYVDRNLDVAYVYTMHHAAVCCAPHWRPQRPRTRVEIALVLNGHWGRVSSCAIIFT